MSRAEIQKGYGPYGGPGYPYQEERGEPSRIAQPMTILPPMSSLLRPEQEQAMPSQQQYPNNPYVARQFKPPYNMVKYPAWPTSPTPDEASSQPYYSPPRPMSPDNTIEDPYASPISPSALAQHILAFPLKHEQPLVQRRTIKKITQRRMNYLKERQQHEDRRNPIGQESNSRTSTPPHTFSPNSQTFYEPARPPPMPELSPYTRHESFPRRDRKSVV